jgi:hypothetical protein
MDVGMAFFDVEESQKCLIGLSTTKRRCGGETTKRQES